MLSSKFCRQVQCSYKILTSTIASVYCTSTRKVSKNVQEEEEYEYIQNVDIRAFHPKIRNNLTVPDKYVKETKDYDFMKKIDAKGFLPKYENIPELQNAPERVKKLFTIEYGIAEDIEEKMVTDFVNEIVDHNDECYEQVVELVDTTVSIWKLQERYEENRYIYRDNKKLIREQTAELQKLLDCLRDSRFELYAKTLSVIGLKHYFEPQYNIRSTEIGDEVSDMRIRAYAESRRIASLSKKRMDTLLNLKEKYQQDLSKNDSSHTNTST